jgi:YHS domain-containing protein
MSRKVLAMLLVFSLGCASFVVAADKEKKEKEPQAKCPISGQAINKDASAEYKGAKVYFCCKDCVAKFEKDTAKYAAKANEQLVVTKQATQQACPFSGGKLNPDTALKVDGISVCFCCDGCKGKVAKAEPDKQCELVFNDKAFEKGFKLKKAE